MRETYCSQTSENLNPYVMKIDYLQKFKLIIDVGIIGHKKTLNHFEILKGPC